ncbi:SMI1/KNR4 family protein [Streptomyces glaucescens]|uniref:SMI1/KNR4 family protein n=1 Tax=Streptomyces glaucescens TaxID=1907 RepID=UPI00344E78F5
MTFSPHGIPAPLRHEPSLEARQEADGDALINALQARAWDPGLRFDRAEVPVAWITERYGKLWLERRRDDIASYGSNGTVTLKSETEVVTGYYADAPRGPLFPPISLSEVERAERRIGRRLPDLLRRLYTEVADGGFGPDGGLASLTDGNRAPGHLRDWPCAASVHERNRSEGMPPSWLFLTNGGCTMEWHVSLSAVDNPVLLYDVDGYTFGDSPHDGLRHATASLRKWLWTWADGGDVWDEVL